MYWNFTEILRTPLDAPLSRGDGSLVVEIGFGNGEYLEHLARTRREALVVGIEVSQWCLCKAARRALSMGLSNVRLLHGDARALLSRAFVSGAINEVYMNFPCPWPKRRHAERRVASPRFAGLMSECLAPEGVFTLATDVGWYAEETRASFAAHGGFEVSPVRENPEREYRTKYERKWIEMGCSTYTVRAKKKGTEEGNAAVEIERGDEGAQLPLEMDADVKIEDARGAISSLSGDAIEGPGYRVVFREVFFAGDGAALVTAISVDEGFEQHYYLRVIPTVRGLRGKVDSVGHPYRTPGVRASLRYVMEKTGAKF